MRQPILFLGLLVFACATPAAQASIVYQYIAAGKGGDGYFQYTGANSAFINIPVGTGNYTVDIYLVETVTDGDISLIAGGSGLKNAAWSFNRQSGFATASFFGSPVDPAQGSGPPNDFGGPDSQRTPTNITGGVGTAFGHMTESFSVTQATGVTGTVNGGVTKVLLGTVTFQVKDPSADSKFVLSAFSPLLNVRTTLYNTAAYGGQTVGLDTDDNGGNIGYTGPSFQGTRDQPFTLLLTSFESPVPEPSSMIFAGLAAIGGGLGCMRRRFAKASS